ncbi:MAG TPA: hypothetical protein VHS96_15550, partial [Bacteroidia bacterium]|nr:hypothetical protein [Bacteroidia bacterium]
ISIPFTLMECNCQMATISALSFELPWHALRLQAMTMPAIHFDLKTLTSRMLIDDFLLVLK